jgi:hypothetical protein
MNSAKTIEDLTSTRVELFPDTYLRKPGPAMELMAVGMLAVA